MLSPKEHLITAYTLRGYSYNEIAKEVGVTEKTIKFHLGRICKKYNVPNRYKLMAKFLDRQLTKEFDIIIENREKFNSLIGDKND